MNVSLEKFSFATLSMAVAIAGVRLGVLNADWPNVTLLGILSFVAMVIAVFIEGARNDNH